MVFYETGEGGKRRFIAVLRQGLVDSPQSAVRAAIVQDHPPGVIFKIPPSKLGHYRALLALDIVWSGA